MSLTGKPATTLEGTVTAGDGWPAIDLADFQAVMRPPAEYSQALIKLAVQEALLWAIQHLSELKDLPPAPAANEDAVELLFRLAVYAQAYGTLLVHFATLNRKPEAENLAKESPELQGYWYTKAQQHILAIKALNGMLDENATRSGGRVALL